MQFTKMHGAGNDFVILDNRDSAIPAESLPALARRLCEAHRSIGADGMMVVVGAVRGGDYGMLYFNRDGSLGEMCGNGARCICRYGYEHGLAGERPRVETTAGLVTGERVDRQRWRVRLNDPSVVDLHRAVTVDGTVYDCGYAELGEPGIPHAVVLLPTYETWARESLRSLGRALRAADAFPRGANVSFVKPLGSGSVQALTYERGVEDFTLACGTGCGAIATVLALRGLTGGDSLTITMPGGELSVSLHREGEKVRDLFLTGPTCLVCEGEVSEEMLAGIE